jgi:SAM-dependent methyltransferase
VNSYTHGHHESVLRSHRWRTAANSAAYLVPHLRPGLSLLDVGCGPGTITADLAELVAPGRVTALERSESALELASHLTNAELVVGDAHALEFPDGSFDVVHAHQVLQHLADPVRALREMRRVTVPGGIVAARDSDYSGFMWFPRLPELDLWMALYQRAARANGGDPDAGRRLLSMARQAGFTSIVSTASIWCFSTAEDRQWWGGMWAERILHSDMARQLLAEEYATPRQLQSISDAWRRWADDEDGWMAVPHGEILCTVT